jgi:hypothetical protein
MGLGVGVGPVSCPPSPTYRDGESLLGRAGNATACGRQGAVLPQYQPCPRRSFWVSAAVGEGFLFVLILRIRRRLESES